MANKISPLLSTQQQQHRSPLESECNENLPTSLLTMPLTYTIGTKYLQQKRRSVSLSSDSSSPHCSISSKTAFSLPFKKRRFVLIAVMKDDDEENEEQRTNAQPLQHHEEQRQRETLLATPILSIIGPVGLSSAIGEGGISSSSRSRKSFTAPSTIACITPVPGTPRHHKQQQRSAFGATPKDIPQENNKNEEQQEVVDKTNSSTTSPCPPLEVSEPMQTRWNRRNSGGGNCGSSSSLSSISRSNNRNINTIITTDRQNKRHSHPKLNAPLPNGCHGQTSRTQSFCRRGPNFNGSNYCKLHYFDPRYKSSLILPQNNNQTGKGDDTSKKVSKKKKNSSYATNGNATDAVDHPLVSSKPGNKSLENFGVLCALAEEHSSASKKEPIGSTSGSGNRPNTTKQQHKKQRIPRDKIYRGSSINQDENDSGVAVEVRCLAISTRGKRCCYASVTSNGNQYCHRHSSFFVGPVTTTTTTNKNNPEEDTEIDSSDRPKDKISRKRCSTLEPVSSSTTTSLYSSRHRSSTTSHNAALDEEAAAAAASDPRPPTALGDLSTDLWQNRRVLVSKGPHKSRIGTVARWRNGWVTVELMLPSSSETTSSKKSNTINNKNKVYHNRRSCELFLV